MSTTITVDLIIDITQNSLLISKMLSIIYIFYIVVFVGCSVDASAENSNLIQDKDDYCKITKDHTLCQFKVNNIKQFRFCETQYNPKDMIN